MGAWLPCVNSGFGLSTLDPDATLYHIFDRILSLLINGTCDLAAKRVQGILKFWTQKASRCGSRIIVSGRIQDVIDTLLCDTVTLRVIVP